MKRRDFVFSVLAPAAVTAFAAFGAGCGGSSSGGSANTGRNVAPGKFTLTFRWPARVATRLIPVLSQSIVATLTSSDGSVLGTRLIVGTNGAPQVSTETFDNLAPGQVTLTATAYPNADGTGTAMATGSVGAVIVSGKTTQVTLTMGSTIDHIDVTPANPTVAIAAQIALTATPKDAAGNVVLVPAANLTWVSGTAATATVSPASGQTVQALGVAVGTSSFTVTESDSGKKGSTTVTVGTASPDACVPGPVTGPGGLANAPWPMFGHDVSQTFRGGAGGATGVLKWIAATGSTTENIGHGSTAIAADGTLFVSNNEDRSVRVLNPTDGSVIRTFDNLGPNPTLGANGFIYAANPSGLFAYDIQSGTQKWNFPQQSGGAIIGADGTVYTVAYVKNSNGTLVDSIVALNGTTGTQKWIVDSTNGGGLPSIGADGTLYAQSSNGGLNAIEGNCGTIRWTFLPSGYLIATTPSIGADGTLFVRAASTSGDNRLYALTSGGVERWHVTVGIGMTSPSIGADGTLYLLMNSGLLLALDPNSGATKFSFTAPGTNPASYGNPGIASDGTVYFSSRSIESEETVICLLFSINGSSGTPNWTFTLPSGSTSTEFVGPVIGPDGTVYITDDDHATIIAVK